jgi:hypothetical protein
MTYTLTAQGPGGPVTKSIVVTVLDVEIEYFIADPSEILLGQQARLRWKVMNADSVVIDNGIGPVQLEGETIVSPEVTTVYTITATRGGQVITAQAEITVINVRIAYFIADPDTIGRGETSTLRWKVENADTIEILGIGAVQAEGTLDVAPAETTTYTLIAVGGGQEVRATVVVHIAEAEILYFVAEPMTIKPGAQSRLSWEVINADSVEITGIGPVQPVGYTYVAPLVDTTYTLTATQGTQVITATVTVTIARPQILYFIVEPTRIVEGEQAQLRWKVVDATSISIVPDVGIAANAFEGEIWVSPTTTTTYVLTAYGAGDPITMQITLEVGPPNQPPVAYAGPDLTVSVNTLVMIDGFASDPDGDPITILWTVVDQPAGATPALSSYTTEDTSFTPTVPGLYAFKMQVTDSKGASAEDTVVVKVWPAP